MPIGRCWTFRKFAFHSQTCPRDRAKGGAPLRLYGNVHDEAGQSTYCHGCAARLIGRDWYTITAWGLDLGGRCAVCGETCPGLFEALPGSWGARREPVVVAAA